jgi:hypothetical protein
MQPNTTQHEHKLCYTTLVSLYSSSLPTLLSSSLPTPAPAPTPTSAPSLSHRPAPEHCETLRRASNGRRQLSCLHDLAKPKAARKAMRLDLRLPTSGRGQATRVALPVAGCTLRIARCGVAGYPRPSAREVREASLHFSPSPALLPFLPPSLPLAAAA